MAGRGTDIMLGGNAEYLAKSEMRKLGYTEELIAESTAYGETENEEILEAREKFKELNAKYKDEIKSEAQEVCDAAACSSLEQNGMIPDELIISCAAVPDVRATPVKAASICRWKTT